VAHDLGEVAVRRFQQQMIWLVIRQ
jgi:hypothetical protein